MPSFFGYEKNQKFEIAERVRNEEATEEEYKQVEAHKIAAIFVVFRSMEGQKRALQAFKKQNSFCGKVSDQSHKFMGKHNLVAEQAVAPELIKWENLNISFCKKVAFRLVTFIFTIIN